MARAAPENYVTKVKRPQDFDQFWDDVLSQVDQIPLDAETTLDPLRSDDKIEVYQVRYTSMDNVRIFSWYCLPRDRAGKLPAILFVPGYNSDPPIPLEWAELGYAAVSVAPRGKIRSNSQFNPGYPGLLTYGIVDRNVYSYRGFYIDAARGFDFLVGRDEVDESRIGVTGSSQGGGLTISTAALRPEVKAAASGVSYLCGFVDAIELTSTYPYQEINDYLRLHPESRQWIEETVAYFDGINFASRVRCPIIVNIGVQDNVCPAETGYALFNVIASEDKKFYAYEGHGHDGGRSEHGRVVEEFFHRHLKA